jgi:hypothetical protein
MHIPVPQTPFEQESEQQSGSTLQLPPTGAQVGLTAHVPLTQDQVQQLPSEEQLAPAGAQTGVPPAPPVAPLPPPPALVGKLSSLRPQLVAKRGPTRSARSVKSKAT